MYKKFKDIYNKEGIVGNIEFFDDKLMFSDDQNSCNSRKNCICEIPFSSITEKVKYNSPILTIITRNEKYEFEFKYEDDYNELYSLLSKKI